MRSTKPSRAAHPARSSDMRAAWAASHSCVRGSSDDSSQRYGSATGVPWKSSTRSSRSVAG